MRNQDYLPDGSVLAGGYRVEEVLGAGGFGITYRATDLLLNKNVVIKEYFPRTWAAREGVEVMPKYGAALRPEEDDAPSESGAGTATAKIGEGEASQSDDYQWGLKKFLAEAQTIAKYTHPNIVRIWRYFQENNTAYLVLDFEEGRDFRDWLADLGRPPNQAELDTIVASLMDALEMLHGNDCIHRDIAPDNVRIRSDGSPVILDFGAVREAPERGPVDIAAIVKPGYSPPEQYTAAGDKIGPWSDIYAMAAMLHEAISGATPPDSTFRLMDDTLPPLKGLAGGDFREDFLAGLDQGLAPRYMDRPQNIAEWRRALFEGARAASRAEGAMAQARPRGSKIFISYRRNDTEDIAWHLVERLENEFGKEDIYFDVDAIPFGVDFRQHIEQALSQCAVVLAVIGPDWMSGKTQAAAGETDYVQFEIETAFQYRVPVIPVLSGAVAMPPPDQIPEPIRAIHKLNAATLSLGRDFRTGMDRLVTSIRTQKSITMMQR